MTRESKPEPKSDMQEPPGGPPVALDLFDDDDLIRHIGDQVVALAPSDASALLIYLEKLGALQ